MTQEGTKHVLALVNPHFHFLPATYGSWWPSLSSGPQAGPADVCGLLPSEFGFPLKLVLMCLPAFFA